MKIIFIKIRIFFPLFSLPLLPIAPARPPVIKSKNMRLSYSALETFQRCPLKFKFQYLERLKTKKSKEALFGTLLHSVLKVLHEPGLFVPTEEEILKYLSDNWNSSIYEDERENAAALSQAVKILKDYYAKNYPAKFNILALETPFETPIEADNELHLVTGKIDRVDKTEDGTYEVIDYKTAKKMPSQESVNENLQLSVYHLGLANRWPSVIEEKKPIKVSLYFLKHGEKLSSLRTPQDIEITKEKIIKNLEKIKKSKEQEKFQPLPSPLCDWCEYQRFCPLFKHKFVEEKIFFNDQDVKALIGEYILLKNEIDERDKKMDDIKMNLSKFMEQENMERLFAEDGYISRQLIQRFKYDSETLKALLEPLGLWNEILKVDDAKLKKISKQLPSAVREKIENAKKLDKEYKTFSVKKEKKIKR